MKTRIPEQLREFVIERANYHCEYCRLHQDDEPIYPKVGMNTLYWMVQSLCH